MKHVNTLQPMMADQSQSQYEDDYGVLTDYPEKCTEEPCNEWIDIIQDFRPHACGSTWAG